MKKNTMITMMALLLSSTAIANPVTTGDAKQKAADFLKKQATSVNGPRRAALQNPQLTEAQAFGDALHVFNVGGNNGFVIVSGDDRTESILGYVDGGDFDINKIPDNMRFWLQMYADQINSLGSANVQKAPSREAYANIEPMLTTNWDQRDDYNDMLFFDDAELSSKYDSEDMYTGCAATSMAQALFHAAKAYKANHGSWPAATTAIPSYTPTDNSLKGVTLPELPPISFDWDNMLNNYSRKYSQPTDAQIKAVGKLMVYCGRALHMEYGTGSSDAAFVYMPFRMAAYFGIQEHVKNMDRQYYTSQKWEDLIYNELANGRVVPYTGVSGSSTSDPGHAFVLDGYKDGLWHVNWGWGMAEAVNDAHYNGYFSLSVMQPDKSGTAHVSGGALDSEYKYLQQATIGVSYDEIEGVANTMYTHIPSWGSYSSSSTEVTYLNYNVQGGVYTLDGAWAIDNGNGTYTVLKKDYEDRLFNRRTTDDYGEYGDLTTKKEKINALPVTGIEDGTYTLIHVSSLAGEDNWVADDGTDLMNFTITVSNGSITNVVYHPQAPTTTSLSIANIEFIGDMEAKKDNIVRVTINNSGDDFWGKLSMYYSTGTSPSLSQKVEFLAAIKPGETTHEFTVNLPKGEYNLWFIANGASASASNAFGTAKMLIGFGADANKIQIGNLQFEDETDGTVNAKSINGQLSPINGSFDVDNKAMNTYSKTYYANIETVGSYYTPAQVVKTVEVPVSVAAGTKETVNFTLDAEGLNASTTYVIRVYQKDGNDEVEVGKVNLKLAAWFRYWLAGGTVKEAKEPDYYNPLSAEAKTAIAVDCRGLSSTTYMDDIANENCLFYITADQKPTSSWNPIYGRNLVIDGVAESMTINADYAFYAPETFEAKEISYKHTFTTGNNGDGKGWETIVLPFEVNSVKSADGKTLKWFKSANDKRCHFWLMELTDATADALTFDYATTFEANKPYIISVPGDKWGNNWNLAGKEITFFGKNVQVPVTVMSNVVRGDYTFTGTYATATVSGYILNGAGDKFENGEGEVKGYNAYIASVTGARALRIIIGGDTTTGISELNTEADSAEVYNLNGMRVAAPQKGIYVKNGKKLFIR